MSPSNISVDSRGIPMLLLKGAWTADTEEYLARDDWRVLTLFHVDWPNYRQLAPFASRITHLRVPFGPDSSVGLTDLQDLTRLEVTDSLSPPVDFRLLKKLRFLETFWDKGSQAFLSNPVIEVLKLHKAKGADLAWIPPDSSLRSFELIGASVKSLIGLESATALEEFKAIELKACTDISSILALSRLRVLEVDAPKAELDNLNWINALPDLNRLMLTSQTRDVDWQALGEHSSLQSIAVTVAEGCDISDGFVEQKIRSGGREFLGIKRYQGKRTTIAIELGH